MTSAASERSAANAAGGAPETAAARERTARDTAETATTGRRRVDDGADLGETGIQLRAEVTEVRAERRRVETTADAAGTRVHEHRVAGLRVRRRGR